MSFQWLDTFTIATSFSNKFLKLIQGQPDRNTLKVVFRN
jgi:hypothetical protein